MFTRPEQASFLFFMLLALVFVIIVTQFFGYYLIVVIWPNASQLTIIILMAIIMILTIIVFFFSFYFRLKDIFSPVVIQVNTDTHVIEVNSPFKADHIRFQYSEKTILLHDYRETRELVFQDPMIQGKEGDLKNGMYRIPRSTYLSLADKYDVFVFFKKWTPITILEFEDVNMIVEEFKLDESNEELTPIYINTLLKESKKGRPFTLEEEKDRE